jgi:lipid A 4'-phosphatase
VSDEAAPPPRRRWAAWLVGGIALLLVFRLFPGLDLAAAALFHRPGEGFPLADSWFALAFFHGINGLKWAAMIGLPALAVLGAAQGRLPFGLSWKAFAVVAATLVVGPALIVNAVLKDHWGRARPGQIERFGGDKAFTPVLARAAECRRNCSFPAGHPALIFAAGFAVAALLQRRRDRRRAVAATLGLGALAGLGRMMQGGHFASDVVASAVIAAATALAVQASAERLERAGGFGRDAWRKLADRARRSLAGITHAARRRRATLLAGGARGGGVGAVVGALGALALVAVFWLDRPLALWLRGGNDGDAAAFLRAVTVLGNAWVWCLGFGGAALALWLAGKVVPALASRLDRLAERALFGFACVSLVPLVGTVLKPLIGRARPRLLFEQGVYGFEPGSLAAAWHSMPSGHTMVAVGVAAALAFQAPRLWPAGAAFALLVAASRVGTTVHYLGDVVVSLGLAVPLCYAVRAVFAAFGSTIFPADAAAAPAHPVPEPRP